MIGFPTDIWTRSLNTKVENNSAAVYVGSSLTMQNPLFFVHKLWLDKLMQIIFLLVRNFKMIGMRYMVTSRKAKKNM